MLCQYCSVNEVESPWTLCPACRREYAGLLHRLRAHMMLLQGISRREYRLTDPSNGGHAKSGVAPAPVDLHAVDLLDEVEGLLQDAWYDAGFVWTDRWQRLVRRMQSRLPALCRAPHAGRSLRHLMMADRRIMPLVDRMPRTRRIVGVCPDCGREVLAAGSESLRRCECGGLVDVDALRAESARKADSYHLTRTPAGLAEWLRSEYGYRVGRKTVTDWLRRGKLPSSRRVEGSDGYWEFNVREVLAMAMGAGH